MLHKVAKRTGVARARQSSTRCAPVLRDLRLKAEKNIIAVCDGQGTIPPNDRNQKETGSGDEGQGKRIPMFSQFPSWHQVGFLLGCIASSAAGGEFIRKVFFVEPKLEIVEKKLEVVEKNLTGHLEIIVKNLEVVEKNLTGHLELVEEKLDFAEKKFTEHIGDFTVFKEKTDHQLERITALLQDSKLDSFRTQVVGVASLAIIGTALFQMRGK